MLEPATSVAFDAFDVVEIRAADTPRPSSWMPNVPSGVWAQSSLPVTFFLGTPTRAEAPAELEVALRTWNRVACSSFRARYGGEVAAVAADDGVNVVLFHDDVWPASLVPGAVAQTIVTIDGGGNIHDADIHLNGRDHRFSLDGAPGTLDLRSVLVHEIGHALGLGHATDTRATMFASGSGVRWRSLEKDDTDGLCALYPGVGAPGCATDPCPTGFVCVADACQRRGERGDLCAPCDLTSADRCEAAGDGARCVDIDGGRVCGRPCATDAHCGAGFACRPTTEAGDFQCVSLEACRNGASPCATDAECRDSVCRSGACVGRRDDPDAGALRDAGADAGASPEAAGAGCDCRTSPWSSPPSSIMLLLACLLGISRRTRGRT